MGRNFDHFMENDYWKSIYDNAPSEELREYYRIMFECYSFDTDENDIDGKEAADERLMEIILTRQDAEYILAHAGSPMAKRQYSKIITWLFDEEESDAVSASMFKGEIRNPEYREEK